MRDLENEIIFFTPQTSYNHLVLQSRNYNMETYICNILLNQNQHLCSSAPTSQITITLFTTSLIRRLNRKNLAQKFNQHRHEYTKCIINLHLTFSLLVMGVIFSLKQITFPGSIIIQQKLAYLTDTQRQHPVQKQLGNCTHSNSNEQFSKGQY